MGPAEHLSQECLCPGRWWEVFLSNCLFKQTLETSFNRLWPTHNHTSRLFVWKQRQGSAAAGPIQPVWVRAYVWREIKKSMNIQRTPPTVDCHHLFVREWKSGIKQWLDAFIPPKRQTGKQLIRMLQDDPGIQKQLFTLWIEQWKQPQKQYKLHCKIW